MVGNRQERGCGHQHRECSRVDRISGRTNGRLKRTKSGSNTSVVPVSYSCRTKIVQTVLDRQRSGVKATIWWFCHDHDRSGRSSMIGNIGKEWSAQCDLGFTMISYTTWSTMGYCPGKVCVASPSFCSSFMCFRYNSPRQCLPMLVEKKKSMQPNLISCQDLFNLATVMVLTIIHPLSSLTWWSDHMKTLSALLALCEQSGTKPNLVAKVLATNFGVFFVI